MPEQTGAGNFTWGYFGGLMDAATGLLYVGNGQYYDPATGRFLTPVHRNAPNPYVPWQVDPLGALLGPISLLALWPRKRKYGKIDRLIVVLVLMAGVSLDLAACNPPPSGGTAQSGSNAGPSFLVVWLILAISRVVMAFDTNALPRFFTQEPASTLGFLAQEQSLAWRMWQCARGGEDKLSRVCLLMSGYLRFVRANTIQVGCKACSNNFRIHYGGHMTDWVKMLVFPNHESIEVEALAGIILDHKSELFGVWEFHAQTSLNHLEYVYAAVFERGFGDYLCVATSGGAIDGGPNYRGSGYVALRFMDAFLKKYDIQVCEESQIDPMTLPSETEMRTIISASMAAKLILRQSETTRRTVLAIRDDAASDIRKEKQAGD